MHVVDGWVQNVFAAGIAHTAGRNRAHERRAGNGQRGGCGDQGDHIGVIDQIVGQHGTHDEDFVLEPIDKQRADRTVDQAAGQGLFLGRASLTLEETTGDFPRRVVFFLIMHGQGEKILSGFGFLGKGHVGHDTGFTQRGNDGPIGLPGNLARFQCEGFLAPLDGFLDFVEHVRFLKEPAPAFRRPMYAAPLPPTPILSERRGQGAASQMGGLYTKEGGKGRVGVETFDVTQHHQDYEDYE